MQRSRRAFLQRRALENMIGARNRFYKLSVSFVFISWAVLLCILWISQIGGVVEDEFNKLYNKKSSVISLQSSQSLGNFLLGGICVASFNATNDTNTTDGNFPSERAINIGISYSLSHSAPIALEEFKRRVFISRSKSTFVEAEHFVHRLEPGGQKYNYASSSKGAKVLSSNKEAKGANNILCGDNDKYLRNPCSSEEKFVVIELSEEILVDTIEMANFEHHSSNVKDFELLGSLSYPTEKWTKLGNFTAGNTKISQPFTLEEAKWVRYLKINLLTHHGSEFYCTLSVFEVYGMDAVERMLQDLLSNQFLVQPNERNNLYEGMEPKVGRSQSDSALKVMLQKVRSLDESLSVLEQYMEVVNSKHGYLFKEVFDDLRKKFELINKAQSDLKELYKSQEITVRRRPLSQLNSLNIFDMQAKEVNGLLTWKTEVTLQIERLIKQNSDLRLEIGKVEEQQLSMGRKNAVIFAVCAIFGSFAMLRMLIIVPMTVFLQHFNAETTKVPERNFVCAFSWCFMLFSCSIILLIVIM